MGSEVLGKQQFFWNLGRSTISRLEIVSSEQIWRCSSEISEWSSGSSDAAADPLGSVKAVLGTGVLLEYRGRSRSCARRLNPPAAQTPRCCLRKL